MKAKAGIYFLITVFSLFLGLVSVNLFSGGMFVDGLDYATISRNMAEGAGSFWKPHLSKVLYSEFYEHPPLAFGIQSLAYRLFGDHMLVERFYSLLTFLITGFLMILIWKKLTGNWHYAWLPLLLWITIPEVLWAAANNILENTMMVFIYLSLLLYLHSRDKYRYLLLMLSGIVLSAAVLTKGFTCLYLWSAPFFFWLFKRKRSFGGMITDSLLLVSATILPLLLFYLFSTEARNNMVSYFNRQVVGSLQNIQTVESRFAIIGKFLQNIIIPLALALLTGFVAKAGSINPKLSLNNLKTSLLFLAIVLAGIFPVMISLKQRGFYILTVYPLFALALGYFVYPLVLPRINSLLDSGRKVRILKIISLLMLTTALLISLAQIGRTGRDHILIHDSKVIIKEIGEGKTVGICPELFSNWSLHGYFARFGHISLDPKPKHRHKYFISDGCNKDSLRENYTATDLPVKKYRLYRKKVKDQE